MSARNDVRPPQARGDWALAGVGALGLAVAAVLAAYARVHPGDGQTLVTFGFSGMLPMKAWLTTGAMALVIVQVLSALSMFGRLGGRAPSWVAPLHRWSGTTAFVLTLPVAFHCVWSLGFSTADGRTLVHSIAGCAFYGAFAAKMLALRLHRLPGWTLPVLGGLVAAAVTVIWFGAALWYFTQPGVLLL